MLRDSNGDLTSNLAVLIPLSLSRITTTLFAKKNLLNLASAEKFLSSQPHLGDGTRDVLCEPIVPSIAGGWHECFEISRNTCSGDCFPREFHEAFSDYRVPFSLWDFLRSLSSFINTSFAQNSPVLVI